jgi:cyclophilin family peptidyl-prolyl cis-trans isomerase
MRIAIAGVLFALCFVLGSFSGGSPKEDIVVIKTKYGNILIWLYKDTPKHRDNFIKLSNQGFFDGTMFHRVISTFMIQGGDPYSADPKMADSIGNGGPGYEIDAEILPNHFHKRGALAAARQSDDINPLRKSSGSQFYIVQGKKWSDEELNNFQRRIRTNTKNDQFTFTEEQIRYYKTFGGTPQLDQQYTVFGEVISGMAFVDSIASVKTNADKNNRPLDPITMDVNIVKMSRKVLEEKYLFVVPN